MMFPNNPLLNFHNLLRLGRASGYPNLQYANPHPFEMSAAAAAHPFDDYPYQYAQGRLAQRGITQPLRGMGAAVGGLRPMHPVGLNMGRNFGPVVGGISHRNFGRFRPQNVRVAPTLLARSLRR